MANMSYCRFENTKSDLFDCVVALENILDDGVCDLANSEKNCADGMYLLCQRYIDAYELLRGEELL